MKTIFTFRGLSILGSVFLLLFSIYASAQTSHNVAVTSNVFTPSTLTINAGDTVIWTNTQGSHNVNGTTGDYPNNPVSFGNNVGTGWTYEFVFNTSGSYEYHCDPHLSFGMTGTITVNEVMQENTLTANFTGMIPHVGQDLWLSVTNTQSGMEIARTKKTVEESFSIEVEGIENGESYNVDFYSDHNGNNVYDAPPADHAWRIELMDVDGNETVDFVHNTTFVDIMWMNKLTVEFTGMTPHVGQNLWLSVTDAESGMELKRVMKTVVEDFSIDVMGIEVGASYYVDFYADLNMNGSYDAPPSDHAWRMELMDVMGDTTLMFAHNTTFTDIMWMNKLTVEFTGMTPHVGQDLWLSVTDAESGMELKRVMKTVVENFSIDVMGIEVGASYYVDFYADLNMNGSYDAPPTDHAWRMELMDVMGDTTLMFVHNTTFVDIMWMNKLTVDFTGMTPHVGQNLWLSVTNTQSGMELKRVHKVVEENFSLHVMGVVPGESYNVDFFADHSGNGAYDAPPTDHAWRLELMDVQGDTTLMFAHNTTFTDIMWKNKLTVNFTDMTPHIGQNFEFTLVNQADGTELASSSLTATESFSIYVLGIVIGESYDVDFYADLSGNGTYDAPPTDHAWRIQLMEVQGDTTLNFIHSSDFTDISIATGLDDLNQLAGFNIYPNPTNDFINVSLGEFDGENTIVKIFNITGAVIKQDVVNSKDRLLRYPVYPYQNGLYFISVENEKDRFVSKFIKN